MNKRMKKKHAPQLHAEEIAELKRRNVELIARQTLIEYAQKQANNRVGQLEEQVSRNAEATNKNFDELRAENTKLRKEIERLKKPWYKRK